MIDIHSHIMYGVDDGPKQINESIEMLHEAKSQGIETIILTPHYRFGMFKYDNAKIKRNFDQLRRLGDEVGITVYLGCEYHVDSDIIENLSKKRCHTLGDGRYVLAEFSHNSEYRTIHSAVQELLSNGYTPIIAHAERYPMLMKDLDNVVQLRNMGCFIQSNADAILGMDGRSIKKICRKLLKKKLIDIVASDSHGIDERAIHLKECRAYIEKKYGSGYSLDLFETNPRQVISSINK